MRTHTNGFKNAIKELGREIDVKIEYTIDGQTITIGNSNLNSVSSVLNGSLLKSVMKEVNIDCNAQIQLGTILNVKIGVKVNEAFEYIDFGNYEVYKNEYNADTLSYNHICYDKMLKTMVDYTDMELTYPITINNYINAICTELNLTFANYNETFANSTKELKEDLYLDLGYTYRDVLDEIAQATASTICINDSDELEIRYINNTNDTIDEHFLNDSNVTVKEKYGPINSIVLSRSGESDNVYLQDTQSVATNGLCEIKIVDNQIMNDNDRGDFLTDILAKLNGLEYFINDFDSKGICYYEICDKYIVSINDVNYTCVLFNDEITVSQGITESIYTSMPPETETNYKSADTTDKRLNRAFLIVDKQAKRINAVVETQDGQASDIAQIQVGQGNIELTVASQTTAISDLETNQETLDSRQTSLELTVDGLDINVSNLSNQTTQLSIDVNELRGEIGDVTDITVLQDGIGTLLFENINESEPILINIHPVGTDISYLPIISNMPISSSMKIPSRRLKFTNTSTGEIFTYDLPTDLRFYGDTYDEITLDYSNQLCQVIKRISMNSAGVKSILATPIIQTYTYPTIALTTGNYTISMDGYNDEYLKLRLMSQNMYTSQFATKIELNSKIVQTKDEIDLEVSTKVGEDEIIGSINLTSESAKISANKIDINGVVTLINDGTTTKIDGNKIETGTIEADSIVANTITSDKLAYNTITADKVSSEIITTGNFSAQNINADNITSGTLSADKVNGGTITGSSINLGSGNFTANGENGAVVCNNLTAIGGYIGSNSSGWIINSEYLYRGGIGGSNGARLYADGRIYMKSNYGWLNVGTGGNFINGNGSSNPVWLADNLSSNGTGSANATIGIRAIYGQVRVASNYAVALDTPAITSNGHAGLTGQVSTIGQGPNGQFEYYMAYYNGLLVGTSRNPFDTGTYPWLI